LQELAGDLRNLQESPQQVCAYKNQSLTRTCRLQERVYRDFAQKHNQREAEQMEEKKVRNYRDLDVYDEILRLRERIRGVLAAGGICKPYDKTGSLLHELSEALPRTIVSGWINEDCRGSEFTIKTAYKEAHAIESLLFQMLLGKVIEYAAALECSDRIQVIKRFLAAHLQQLRNGESV
jgi:hypothetical protein